MLKGEIDVNRRIREERGSVTIEATISLSAFMFAIVTILTIVNICIVQAKMSYAINATAKEISQYSYLYSLTGLNDSQKNLYEKGKLQTKMLCSIVPYTHARRAMLDPRKSDAPLPR